MRKTLDKPKSGSILQNARPELLQAVKVRKNSRSLRKKPKSGIPAGKRSLRKLGVMWDPGGVLGQKEDISGKSMKI